MILMDVDLEKMSCTHTLLPLEDGEQELTMTKSYSRYFEMLEFSNDTNEILLRKRAETRKVQLIFHEENVVDQKRIKFAGKVGNAKIPLSPALIHTNEQTDGSHLIVVVDAKESNTFYIRADSSELYNRSEIIFNRKIQLPSDVTRMNFCGNLCIYILHGVVYTLNLLDIIYSQVTDEIKAFSVQIALCDDETTLKIEDNENHISIALFRSSNEILLFKQP